MTFNIRTNGEIWDVSLDAKQVVIGSLGKQQVLKKQTWAFIQNPDWPWNASVHLHIFKIGEKPA